MNKYLSIFKISFQQEFVYRLNFIMWRVRNIMQIILIFFLWDSVFADPNRELFGYDRAKILTYVFGILIVRAFVFSSRSHEVAGEIADGNLSNYLLKPVSYFKYWLTRDISSKSLNLFFAAAEFGLLYYFLKPPFFFQNNIVIFLSFVVSLILAILLLFVLIFLVNLIPFWLPELAWGAQFLFLVIIAEFLSGAIFPLDILPTSIQNILYLTPFPYLIFFPLQVYLGKFSIYDTARGILIALLWVVALRFVMDFVWRKGLKAYRAEGR